MFRPEKYVIINGTQLSRNGFKNLTFETSKFSNSISAIRGFGTTLDENNLNTIDTLSVEFYIDVTELKEFAYIYSLFKAYGALPIENDYILEKLKGSLSFERSIVDFKETDLKKQKVVTHLIVFLQQMHITSLEKTNNGYSVNMIFTLHKNGLSSFEYETFRKHFVDWDAETGFTSICETAISKHLKELINKDDPNAEGNDISFASGKGSMDINIYNIEKLNAKNKGKMYISALPSLNIDDQFDAVEKETLKLNILREFENLEAKKTISISNKNIIQIELITNNIISNTPIYGESIGIKSFLGLGQSTFTVKMIFDENDKDILEELKTLSDKNISSHKIELVQPLVNLFDFHSASINNIIFNNIEQANGVMVTILFKINSYNYFDSDKLNFSSIINYETEIGTNKNNSITGFWLESCIEHILKNEKKIVENSTASKNKTPSTVEKFSHPYSRTISEFLETIIEISHEKDLTESGNSDVYKSYVGNFLSYYNSPITAFQVFKKGEVNNMKRQSRNKIPLINSDKKDLFFSKHFNVDKIEINFDTLLKLLKEEEDYDNELLFNLKRFYNYCDIIACYTALSNDTIKNSLAKACNSDKEYSTQMYNVVFQDFISNLYNPSANMIGSNETFVSTMVIKEFYDKLPFILRKPAIKKLVDEINQDSFFSATNIVYYKQIHKRITELFDAFYKEFLTSLADEYYLNFIVSAIIEAYNTELYKDSITEMTKDTVRKFINDLRKEYKRIYEADRIDIIDRAYNIFLAKYCFGLSSKCFSKKVFEEIESDITHEQYLRVILFSSCFMSLLLLRTTYRTDSFGVIFENSVQKIAEKISVALDKAYKYDLSTLEKEVRTNFIETFKSNVTDSYYINSIDFNNIRNKSSTPLIKLNKDYNFFYGKQIENLHPERYIDVVIESSEEHAEDLNAYHDMNDFIDEQKYKFIEDRDYTEWVEIKDPFLTSKIKEKPSSLPTLAEGIMRNGDNVSHIMKKRIIGNRDPFNELKKLTNIVNDWNTKVIPDYDIIVSHKEYFSDYNGAYASIKLNSFFSINNLINVSISKNSSKKIKTAIIKLVDINKQILENSEDGTVGIITNVENRLQFVSINNGDKVDINFGYVGDKKNIFKGYINKISYFGNVLEITCHDTASILYNYTIDQLTLKADKTIINSPKDGFQEIISNFVDGAKSMFSASMLSNQADAQKYNHNYQNIKKLSDDAYKFTNKEVRINLFEGSTINSHLFDYTPNQKQKYRLNTPGLDPEAASMYSATVSVFCKQPAFIKALFDENNFYNKYNLAAMHERNLEELRSVFGDLLEKEQVDLIYYKPTREMFSNMNNIDRDYDTYGIMFSDDEASIISIDNSGFASKFDEIEEPVVVPEEEKTSPKEETIYKAPEEVKPLEDPKQQEPSKEESKKDTEENKTENKDNKEEDKKEEDKKENSESSDKKDQPNVENKIEEKDKVADKINPPANKTDSIENTENKKDEQKPPIVEDKPPVDNKPSSENKTENNKTESPKKEDDKIVVVPSPPEITDEGVEKFDSEKPKDDNKNDKDENVIVKDNTVVTTDKVDKTETSKGNEQPKEPEINLPEYAVTTKPNQNSKPDIYGVAGVNPSKKEPPKQDPPKKEPIKNDKPENDKKPDENKKPEYEKPTPEKPPVEQPKPDKPKEEKPTEDKKDETPKVEKPSKEKKDEATKKEEAKKTEADKKSEAEKSELTPVEKVDENDISIISNRNKIFDTMPCRGRKITGIFKEARKKKGVEGGIRFHLGIDISHMNSGDYKTEYDSEAGEKKDDLLAIAKGKVESVTDSGTSGGGKVVKIYHEDLKMKTVYMHLNSFNVKKDDQVEKGAVIGQMGNTGSSGGHHLHFEIHIQDDKGAYVHADPIDYLGVDFHFDWKNNIGKSTTDYYKIAKANNFKGNWIHWKNKKQYIDDYKKEVEEIKKAKSDTRNISADVELEYKEETKKKDENVKTSDQVTHWYSDRTGAKKLDDLVLSSDGFMALLKSESIVLSPYQDEKEVSISAGHSTASASGVFVKDGELTKDLELTSQKELKGKKTPDTKLEISLKDAILTLFVDIEAYHKSMVQLFKKNGGGDMMFKQHEYDALFCLHYNLPGTEKLYQELIKKEKGDMKVIRKNFLDGIRAQGEVKPELKKRRVEEFALFLFGYYKGISINKDLDEKHTFKNKDGSDVSFWDIALNDDLTPTTHGTFSDTDSINYYDKSGKGAKKLGTFSKADYESYRSDQNITDKMQEFKDDDYKAKTIEEKLKEQADKEKEAVSKREEDKKNQKKKKK